MTDSALCPFASLPWCLATGGLHVSKSAAVRAWGRSLKPERRYLAKDLIAGLPGAVSSVPDGMASAVLVGINPVHGCTRASPGRSPRA